MLGDQSVVILGIGGNSQGVDYGFLNVTGNVTFGGTLLTIWDNGFTATNADAFDLIQTGGVFSGTFKNTHVPTGVLAHTFNTTSIFQLVTDTVSPNIIFCNEFTLFNVLNHI